MSCRWWSGFDLVRRLLFITVVFFFTYVQPGYTQVFLTIIICTFLTSSSPQIALLITGLLIFTVFVCSKPYDGKWSNRIEALVLFDLLALTSLFLDTDTKHREGVRPLALILLLSPFLSIVLYIIAALVIVTW